MRPRPYLSLVMTGRNDNYGGDFRTRLQTCILHAHKQLVSRGIPSEIIFVNYNPVPDSEPIERFVQWPSSTDTVSVRVITVPGSIHEQLINEGRKPVPVLEYLGKNAGIRRAEGRFILCMNPDIVLTDELVRNLGQLNDDTYYRADRVDFTGDLDADHQFVRVYLKGADHPIWSLSEINRLRRSNAWRNRWRAFTPRIRGLLNLLSIPVYYNNAENRFHCNVSGDFMLMHRDRWFALEGYHERTPIALHVDALMVVQAAVSGLKEKVFDHPIFHQEHARRYDATKEDQEFLQAFELFTAESKEMLQTRVAKKYNGPDWGLSNFELPEMNL